ncbi:hypothetical protein HY382_02840 [Candidatus Curtissbacteria bacterium]|nr:hypothetical protein [Candidatus Curtissbacteria bacterium]
MAESAQSGKEIRRLAKEASETEVTPEAKNAVRQLEEHRPLSSDEIIRATLYKRSRKLLPAVAAIDDISADSEQEAADKLDKLLPDKGTSLEK